LILRFNWKYFWAIVTHYPFQDEYAYGKSEDTKINQKNSHGSYRTTNTSRLLSRAENDNRYSRQFVLHFDEKRLNSTKLKKNKKTTEYIHRR
jgi:hypothetical protein